MSGDRPQHRGNRLSPDRGNRHMKKALPFGRAYVSGGPTFREGLRFGTAHVSGRPTFRDGLRFGTAMWWVGQRLATSIGCRTCGEDRVSRGGEVAICPQSRGGSQAAKSVRLAACLSARLGRRPARTVGIAVVRPARPPVAYSGPPDPPPLPHNLP